MPFYFIVCLEILDWMFERCGNLFLLKVLTTQYTLWTILEIGLILGLLQCWLRRREI